MKTLHLFIVGIITSGVIATALIIYDYDESHNIIAKKQAIDIAMQGFHCKKDYYSLNSSSVNEQLFHVKDNNVFFVDDKNMQDMATVNGGSLDNVKSSGYVWEVSLQCYDHTLPINDLTSFDKEWDIRFIDANSGDLLK